MKDRPREFTFLVRIWRADEESAAKWRGSVREVSSGKRRFISGTGDISEFIASYLRGESRTET
jgi:hypothetical protein